MNVIYHYTTGEGLLGIINSMELHFTNMNFLNDPTESTWYKQVLEDILSENIICKDIYNELYNESYMNIYISPTYIASFCKERDSLSMWKHYSKGNGYNIGFKIDSFLSNKDIIIEKKEIIYDVKKQKKILTDHILRFGKRIDSVCRFSNNDSPFSEFDDLQIEFCDKILNYAFQFKHFAYKDEEEIRLIIPYIPYGEKVYENKYRKYKVSDNGVIVEYTAMKFSAKDIVSITCHPQSLKENEMGVRYFINNKTNSNEVKVYRSQIPFRNI